MRFFFILLMICFALPGVNAQDASWDETVREAWSNQDYVTVYNAILPHAENGHEASREWIGRMVVDKNMDREQVDMPQVLSWLQTEADADKPVFQRLYGLFLIYNDQVDLGVTYLAQASQAGNLDARFSLGMLHWVQDFGIYDLNAAISYFESVAEVDPEYISLDGLSVEEALDEARFEKMFFDSPFTALLQFADIIILLCMLVVAFITGSIVEKRHYKQLRCKEEMLMHVPFVNDTAEWIQDAKDCKMVGGTVVVAVDFFKAFLFGIRNIFGGSVSAYDSIMDRGRREAMIRMREKATDAAAITNVRVETTCIKRNTLEIIAYGTAIYT